MSLPLNVGQIPNGARILEAPLEDEFERYDKLPPKLRQLLQEARWEFSVKDFQEIIEEYRGYIPALEFVIRFTERQLYDALYVEHDLPSLVGGPSEKMPDERAN